MNTTADDSPLAPKRTPAQDLGRVMFGAALLLLVPLVAMQLTDEVKWDLFDFAAAGFLLVGTGLLYVLFTRKAWLARHRFAVGLALATALLLVWMELAVGIVGSPFAGS